MSIERVRISEDGGKDDFFRDEKTSGRGRFQITPYIDDPGLENIHTFKYAGSDTSIGYN